MLRVTSLRGGLFDRRALDSPHVVSGRRTDSAHLTLQVAVKSVGCYAGSMGYKVSGSLSVSVSTESETMLALSHRGALSSLDSWYLDQLDEMEADAPLSSRVLCAIGFEGGPEIEIDAEMQRRYFYQSNWFEGVDLVLGLLAECGFSLAGKFVCEDDAAWAVSSEHGALREEALTRVPVSRVSAWVHAESTLDAVRSLLVTSDAASDSERIAQLREIVSRPQELQGLVASSS